MAVSKKKIGGWIAATFFAGAGTVLSRMMPDRIGLAAGVPLIGGCLLAAITGLLWTYADHGTGSRRRNMLPVILMIVGATLYVTGGIFYLRVNGVRSDSKTRRDTSMATIMNNRGIVTQNQSGGINTIINGVVPEYKPVQEIDSNNPDGTHNKKIIFDIIAPASPAQITLRVTGNDIKKVSIPSVSMFRDLRQGPSIWQATILSPRVGRYEMIVTTATPTRLEISHSF